MIAFFRDLFRRAKPEPLTVMKALEQYRVAQFSNSQAVRKAASDALERAKGRKS